MTADLQTLERLAQAILEARQLLPEVHGAVRDLRTVKRDIEEFLNRLGSTIDARITREREALEHALETVHAEFIRDLVERVVENVGRSIAEGRVDDVIMERIRKVVGS